MSERVVVDASVAAKWLLDEDGSEEARRLADTWSEAGIQPAAPQLLRYEITNTLYQRIRRKQLPLELALARLLDFYRFAIRYVDTDSMNADALRLAVELEINAAYDAHYLVLAERLDCECWTADNALARAASGLGDRVRLLSRA